jgi:hypothetical protein
VNCCSAAVLAATNAGESVAVSLYVPMPRSATTGVACDAVGVMLPPPAGMLSNVMPSVLPLDTRTLPDAKAGLRGRLVDVEQVARGEQHRAAGAGLDRQRLLGGRALRDCRGRLRRD